MPINTQTKISNKDRIYQGYIFHNIDVIENFHEEGKELLLQKINFPYVICLTQDCDLSSDYLDKINRPKENRNCRILHLIVAPLFNFEKFKNGEHWGDIFDVGDAVKENKSTGKSIMNNETPRYHYLNFDDKLELPPMIVDFKHFFTLSSNYLYSKLDNRICTVSELFRERISQRFTNYLSRIGLPDQ